MWTVDLNHPHPHPTPTQACLEPMSGCGSARWSPDLHCMALVGSDDVMGGRWGCGDGGGAGLSLLQDVSLSAKLSVLPVSCLCRK